MLSASKLKYRYANVVQVSSFSSAIRSQLVWVLREIRRLAKLKSFLIWLWKYVLRCDEKQPFKNQSLHIKEWTCGERHMRSPKVEFWGGAVCMPSEHDWCRTGVSRRPSGRATELTFPQETCVKLALIKAGNPGTQSMKWSKVYKSHW